MRKRCRRCGSRAAILREDGYTRCRKCKNKGMRRWYLSRMRNDRPYMLWQSAKERARRHGILFTITPDDVRAAYGSRCPVLGVQWDLTRTRGAPNAPSLDRLSPNRGYVPGNIAVISMQANKIKSDAHGEQVLRVYRWMRKQGL